MKKQKKFLQVTPVLIIMILFFFSEHCWPGETYRPWLSTMAILIAGESFEVWFDTDADQVVDTIILSISYQSMQWSFSVSQGDWVVDPLPGTGLTI